MQSRKPKQPSLFGPGALPELERARLLSRLEDEGADDLTEALRKCGLELPITCRSCGHVHKLQTRCNRKWCPVCARQIAAKRAAKLQAAALTFRWPLFLTLTVENIASDDYSRDFVRELRRSFGKLRNRKIWKKRVKAGAAAIEITNTGNGWHPHIHALLDCRWLAIDTPEPTARMSPEAQAIRFRQAAEEITAVWQKCVKTRTASQVKVKRADMNAAREVMKYAVKGSDLIDAPDEIAPILRMMDGTRLVTTFGECYGLELPEEERPPLTCPNGHTDWTTQRMRPGAPTHDDDGTPYPDGYHEWPLRQRLAWRRSRALDTKLDEIIAAEEADDIPF